MAKTKRSSKAEKKESSSGFNKFSIDKFVPVKYQTPAAIGIILILFFIFYAPMFFDGKIFQSGDIITGESFETVQKEYDNILWNPYVFCGLPAYISGVTHWDDRWFDFINYSYSAIRVFFGNIFNNDHVQSLIFLILLSIAAFSFMRYKNASVPVSLFVAFAIAFSTGISVFMFIGHISKLFVLSVFPFILIILFKFQERITFLNFILLSVVLSLFFYAWHIQVIFYSFFAIGIYYLFFFIKFLIKKQSTLLLRLAKSAVVFIAATILGFLTQLDTFWQIYEYTEYSTRGTKSITEIEAGETAGSESAFYDYATEWSFSPGEVLTFIVPSYYGFGNVTYKGPLSNNQDVEINTYFGQMNFVDVAMYMGVLVFFFGLFGMYAGRKQPLVQYLTILVIISLLISFGKNFSPVFDLMFYYFPFFDKFRVPSMILILVQISFPILAGVGIMEIISLRNQKDQRLINLVKYSAFIFTGLLILSFLLSNSLASGFESRIAESTRGQQLSQIKDFMSDMFLNDLYLAMLLCASAFWLAYGYINNKLSGDFFVFAILAFTIIDLFRISGRGAKFVEQQDVKNIFNEPGYVTAIKNQNDEDPFRILSLKQGSLGSFSRNSNYHVYFLLQDFGGYSGIKPRSYQDYIDVIGPANQTLWKMLNVKYLVLDNPVQVEGFTQIFSQEKTFLYEYQEALPRAYFVNQVESKKPIEILNDIKNNKINPKNIAYTSEDLNVDIPDSTAFVDIINYSPDYIKISSYASGNNFMFLGDTYYPHGWKAKIDGEETKIYRVNHGFRGIIIPQGKHEVEFTYAPQSYYIGKNVSIVVNLVLIVGFITGIVLTKKRKKVE